MAGQALVKAVSSGRLAQVKILLKMGINVNCQDQHGQTPLIHAMFLEDPRLRMNILRILLKNGALVSPLDSENMNAIMWACSICAHEDFALLLRHADVDVNFNAQNSAGQTALWLAMEHGELEIVKDLLRELSKNDLVFEVPDHQGMTPAMRAASLRNYNCLQAMIAHLRNVTKTANNAMSVSKVNEILRSEKDTAPRVSRFIGSPRPANTSGQNTPRPPTFTESPRPLSKPGHNLRRNFGSFGKPGQYSPKSSASVDSPRPVNKSDQSSLRPATFPTSPDPVSKSEQYSHRQGTFADSPRTASKLGQSSPNSSSHISKSGQNSSRPSTFSDSSDPLNKSGQHLLNSAEISDGPQSSANGTNGCPAVPTILITTPNNHQWQDRAGPAGLSNQRHRAGSQTGQPLGHYGDPATGNSTPLLSHRQSAGRTSAASSQQQWSPAEAQQQETNNQQDSNNVPRRKLGHVSHSAMVTPTMSPEQANDHAASRAPPPPSSPQRAVQQSLVYLPHHELRRSTKPKVPGRKQISPHPSTTESKESIKRSLNLKVETIKWTRSPTSPSTGKSPSWSDGVFTPSAKDMAKRKKPPSIAHDILPMLFNLSAQLHSDSFRKPAVTPMPRRRKRTVTRWTKLRSIALLSRGLVKGRVRKTSGLGLIMPPSPKSPGPSSHTGTLGLSLRPKSPRPASLSGGGSADSPNSPTSPALSTPFLARRKISGGAVKV